MIAHEINSYNLHKNEIKEAKYYVKFLFIDENNNMLIHYDGESIDLPFIKCKDDQMGKEEISKKVLEKYGYAIFHKECDFFLHENHYVANYPKENGDLINILFKIKYYVVKFNIINIKKNLDDNKENLILLPLKIWINYYLSFHQII